MSKPVIRSLYQGVHPRSARNIKEWSKSRTLQSDKDAADINNIMRRFETTGALPNMIRQEPAYGDFSNAVDYRESLDIVMKAREQFANLNAKIRARFENDPAQFLEFCNDEKNLPEMAKMGLLTPEAVARVRAELKAKEESPAAPERAAKAKKQPSPTEGEG